jgi:ABC-three component (ABC-3C) system Middle Component 3
MKGWAERSPESAALLNPALLAVVCAAAASQYERESGEAMPWPLAFLVAPLVLHRGTRDVLPRSIRSHLSTWITSNPVIRAGFPQRAQSLTGLVREGLRFGMAYGALSVTAEGGIRGILSPSARPIEDGDAADIVRSAGFVGKWFTKADQPATLFALLGVAP